MRGTLFLLVVCGGLGVVWYYAGQEPEVVKLTTGVFDERQLVEAERLEIVPRPGQMPIQLARENGRLMIVEPIRDLASEATVRELTTAYTGAEMATAYEADELDAELLEQTGLAEPRASLRAHFRDQPPVLLEFGGEGPLGRDVFIRRGDRVYRAHKALYSVLQHTPDEYRERQVFRNQLISVQRLRVSKLDGEKVTIERGRLGEFRLVEPRQMRLDQQYAGQLLNGILSLRIKNFVAGRLNTGGMGPAQPADATITVEGALGNEVVELRRVGGAGDYAGLVKPRGIAFAATADDYQQILETNVEDLRARWLLPFTPESLERVSLDPGPGGTPLQLAMSARQRLDLEKPVRAMSDPSAVAELQSALRGLGVMRFVADNATELDRYGLADGYLIAKFTGGRSLEVELHVGADADDELTYLRRADEPHVVAIPKAVADVFRRPWTSYASKEILEATQYGRLRKLTARRGDQRVDYARDDEGDWRPAGGGEPSDDAWQVVDDLRTFSAQAVVDAKGARDLGAPIHYEFAAENGDVLYELDVYDSADGVLCEVPNRPLLYRLENTPGKTLRRLFPN